MLKSLVGSSLEDPTIDDVSISVNVWPLSAKLTSFMTRSIVDRFSELVFCKSHIGPGRKTSIKGARKFLRQVRDCQTPKNAAGRQICFYT